MSVWQAALAGALAVLCALPAEGQSLGDVARSTEAKRKGATGSPLVFDARDVDPAVAGYEVVSYEITDERWRTFKAADIWVTQTLEKDPALWQRLSALKGDSVRTLERFILREPAIVAALQSAGSNPHDYAYTQVALLAAILVHAQQLPAELKANLPTTFRANVEFVAKHEQELKEMTARLTQLKERLDKGGGSQ
jgi:hypothetical protein